MSGEPYLDIERSVIISSPAGSGKTEKLSRRYISLLEAGSPVEKILCITFTEKAAAEMKQRILRILAAEHPELHAVVMQSAPLMRISTIHAFCLKVLKRFSIELGLDPSLDVMDETEAANLWTEAMYDALRAEGTTGGTLTALVRDRGLKGWARVRRLLDTLHRKEPFPSIMIESKAGLPEGQPLALLSAYAACLALYVEKKQEKHVLDFNDLELLAHKALALGAEAYSILYSFDEHTDHLLVDEFQDTSTLQWRIIDKLTEEWRAGWGPKREGGTRPTIFLVGDEKQSIYLFRGANVSIFRGARDRLHEWLGDEYHYVEVKENYRSLPAIVEFTNTIFGRIMQGTLLEPWRTTYAPFEARRTHGEGRVDLLTFGPGENTPATRQKEAGLIARQIRHTLHDKLRIYDREGESRSCTYGDMAILIRKRTHLGAIEEALRAEGVPFIVVKGVGFYSEPEIAILRDFVCLLADPSDDYALFNVLRSPLGGLTYHELAGAALRKGSLMQAIKESESPRLGEVVERIMGWQKRSARTPLAVLMEEALVESGAWRHFASPQRQANVRKFLAIVEGFDATGASLIEVREHLIRGRSSGEVARANVNAEGMDAVRIMTVHAAKGLQFPVVFLPSLDEKPRSNKDAVVFDDTDDVVRMGFEEDSTVRKSTEIFRYHRAKEEEEEKRLFYVGVTRAMDYLCLSGALEDPAKPQGKLHFMESLDLVTPELEGRPFHVLHETEVPESGSGGAAAPDMCRPREGSVPVAVGPVECVPEAIWKDVTEDMAPHARSHGEHWTLIGTVMHTLLDEISKGTTALDDAEARVRVLFRAHGAGDEHVGTVMADLGKLEASGLMESIIMPRDGGYAELPFVLKKGQFNWRGRIDRVVVEEGHVRVYDYKSFPVSESEMPEVMEKYRFQMATYCEAAGRLFRLPASAHLVFTHLPSVVEVDS